MPRCFRSGNACDALARKSLLILCQVAAVVSFLIAPFACLAAPELGSKRVLVLHSFGRDFKPWSVYATAIRTELEQRSPWPLEIIDLSLMTARGWDENPELPFIQYLQAQFNKRPADLIVSIGAPAANFVQRHRDQLFPTTPMIFAVVEQRRVQQSQLTEFDTVVAVAHDLPRIIENILQVLPGTTTIAVVNGDSTNERFWLEELRREFAPFADRVSFVWYNDRSFPDILKHAGALPPNSAIFWHLMSVDAAGTAHEGETALQRLYAVANAPIFSFDGSFFEREIVGGPMHAISNLAGPTADAAIRIFGGEKAGDIKIPASRFAAPVYDWRLLQRWGIPESRLPPGSEVRFRVATVWEQHQATFAGISAVVLLQAGMIAWLLYEQSRRRRLEAAAHAFSGRLISAQEEERSRLARELHDDVTQRLAALAIKASIEERKAPMPAAATMGTLREGLVKLGEDVHSLSYRLHPSTLMDLGLREALQSECKRFSQVSPLQLMLNLDECPEQVPPDAALCLFRIAQESLRNIARHAGASRAEIRLRRQGGGLQLTVQDDGVGFDLAKGRKASLGLASMRQRIALLGGKFKIDTRAGAGTGISAWVPLDGSRMHPGSL
jgi:signal transduction histidine kinase